MDDHTIPRSGLPPLFFRGELVAQAGAAPLHEKRYHAIDVYHADTSRYILVIRYVSLWRGETGHIRAIICADLNDLADVLAGIDPAQPVQGYPPTPAYADRQQRLLTAIRQRWAQLVSEVLGQLGITEEVQ